MSERDIRSKPCPLGDITNAQSTHTGSGATMVLHLRKTASLTHLVSTIYNGVSFCFVIVIVIVYLFVCLFYFVCDLCSVIFDNYCRILLRIYLVTVSILLPSSAVMILMETFHMILMETFHLLLTMPLLKRWRRTVPMVLLRMCVLCRTEAVASQSSTISLSGSGRLRKGAVRSVPCPQGGTLFCHNLT